MNQTEHRELYVRLHSAIPAVEKAGNSLLAGFPRADVNAPAVEWERAYASFPFRENITDRAVTAAEDLVCLIEMVLTERHQGATPSTHHLHHLGAVPHLVTDPKVSYDEAVFDEDTDYEGRLRAFVELVANGDCTVDHCTLRKAA